MIHRMNERLAGPAGAAVVQFLMASMPMLRVSVLTLVTVCIVGGTTPGAREHGWGMVFAQTGAPVPQSVAPPVDHSTATPIFDVASVHLSAPSPDGHNHIWNDIHESHFRTGNLSIRDLIQYAYNLPKSQIVGGPGWLDSAMYDINAKSSPEVDARLKGMPDGDAAQQKRLMVRELLKERFSLTTHEETRVLPVYNLVLAKGGAKFQPSDHSGTTIDAGRSRIHVQGSDDTIGLLARELAQSQGRVVVNNTGLTGRYDLILRWTPDDASTPLQNGDSNALPGLFTAIQDQLGLKLESGKGPVPVLVIDHIEPPSAN
jgi:uncharacterized protein (TIGR03435 family)